MLQGSKAVEIEGSLSRSLLPHQNPRRESSVPHNHLGAHTYYLAEDGPARDLTCHDCTLRVRRDSPKESWVGSTTARGLQRVWSKAEA